MAMGNYLTRDDILKADDIQVEDVPVPEWGGVVRVRGLTGRDRDQFEAGMVSLRGKRMVRLNLKNTRARLVALCVVDEVGQALFSAEDVEALGAKSAVALERVFDVASRLSGLSPEDVAALEKN